VRVGYDPKVILKEMQKYVKNTYPNGFQLNNPHGIENFSTVPNTINEMLCMGHQGVLRVFPVWPKDKNAGFYKLRTVGAFVVSSELKNGQVQYIKIISEKGRECTVVNPWETDTILIKRDSGEVEMQVNDRFVLNTSEGEKMFIKPIKRVVDK